MVVCMQLCMTQDNLSMGSYGYALSAWGVNHQCIVVVKVHRRMSDEAAREVMIFNPARATRIW